MWTIVDSATRAAWFGAASQQAQLEVLAAALGSAPRKVVLGASGELSRVTMAAPTINTGTTPRRLELGQVIPSTLVNTATGTPTTEEIRNAAGTVILRGTAGISGALVNYAAGAIKARCAPSVGATGIVVQANSALPAVELPGFAAGGTTGSLVGDLWTPARAPDGRVYQASWDTVPKFRWIEAAGTRIDTQLTTAIQAVSPGWDSAKLWGTTPGNSLFQSWAGFTQDEANARFWFLGGGHSDGYNNGLYRFDLYRMNWAIECAPSSYTDFSLAYRTNGNSSYHPDANATAIANFNANNPPGTVLGTLVPALNGPMYDEIPIDGKPTARHTYQGLAYVSTIGTSGSILMHMRRLWRFDLASGQWVFKRLFDDKIRATAGAAPSATGIMETHAAEAALGIWDEATNRMLCSASGSAGAGAAAYNWTTQSWGPWGGAYGLNFNHAAVARVGRTVVSFNPPTSEGTTYKGRYWLYNMDTEAVTFADCQLGGGLTFANFPSGAAFYDGAGMVYVPPLNRYWIWTRDGSGGMQALQLDPTTSPWTLSPLTFANASPVEQRLIIGRVLWIPALSCVLVWDHCFANAFIYRF